MCDGLHQSPDLHADAGLTVLSSIRFAADDIPVDRIED